MLPKEIFDPRKSKTRDPKRKFAAKEYLMEIGRNSKVTDLKTQKIMDLEHAINKFGIIDVQLLDFAGSIFLDNSDWEIQPGFNQLFLNNGSENERVLLEHKLKLSRYLRSFQHQEAMIELEQIMKFEETLDNKFTEFRYICLKGRILMRGRKLEEAKEEFERAYSYLETKFSDEERGQLIKERLQRLKESPTEPNWDTIFVDYDEILLGFFYSYTLSRKDVAGDYENIIIHLSSILNKAKKQKSNFDIVIIQNLLGSLYLRLNKYEDAKIQFMSAIQLVDENNFDHHFHEIYGSMHLYLAEIYASENKFERIDEITSKLDQIVLNSEFQFYYFIHYRLQLLTHKLNSNIQESFVITREYINYFQTHRSKFFDLSPLFIISDIFTLVVQGIKLDKFKKLEDVEVYLSILNEYSQEFEAPGIYEDLIINRFRFSNLLEKEIDPAEYDLLVSKFRKSLEKASSDPSIFIQALTMLYEVLALSINKYQGIKNRILDLCQDISETVHSYPNMLTALINETIKHVILGDLSKYKNKLSHIEENYSVNEITKIIILIGKFENDEIDVQEFILQLISADLYHTRFEHLSKIPKEIFD